MLLGIRLTLGAIITLTLLGIISPPAGKLFLLTIITTSVHIVREITKEAYRQYREEETNH